jgi:hypothetical protein
MITAMRAREEAKLRAEFEASGGITRIPPKPKAFSYWEDLEAREQDARRKERMTKKEQQEKEMLEALEKYTGEVQKLFDTQ